MIEAVLARVAEICRKTFRDPDAQVTRETTADDIGGWDSLAHVEFIAAVETEFDLRFSIAEVARIDTVGDLVDLIESHRARRP